ncbi:DUF4123 domain-containing protein [Pseudomonas sp. J452]|uniref:DUF4123 domain-containing protein n=1 Tax=Pseudomonas sp. J452 TaxID=2898441 RepID=UPI0021AE2C68|nr:DUF4123 domain-containing protein [Pseudomonas sp. J452]UUY09489.1 DUF4123 domain-containing protein [Pseudomonas sp. J452]
MLSTASTWLATLQEQALSHRLAHIDLLIDTTGLNYPLWQSLAELKAEPAIALLLDNTPEQAIAKQGPVLLRLQRQDQEHLLWLQQLLDSLHREPRLLALLSSWSFVELTEHLRHCTQAEWNQGRSGGLLRYWDPRLFLAVSETLMPQQGRWFHAPAIAWHWLDRDDQPRQLTGQPVRPSERPQPLPPLALSNEQVAELVAWMDAEEYRAFTCAQHQEYGLPNRETLQQHLVRAHLDANKQAVVDIEQRRTHVREWLTRNSSTSPRAQLA